MKPANKTNSIKLEQMEFHNFDCTSKDEKSEDWERERKRTRDSDGETGDEFVILATMNVSSLHFNGLAFFFLLHRVVDDAGTPIIFK